jgi:FkbM family methyltransferase
MSFWLTQRKKTVMNFGEFAFSIRTESIFSKISDLCMIYECVVLDDYNIKNYIKDDDIILDIGSHIGSFSICASRNTKKGFIYAFEPSPENFEQLRKNIALNKSQNIIPINKAVLSRKKKTRFYINKTNYASNSIFTKTNTFIEVPCINLSDIFKKYNLPKCNFLKMDCEGTEYDIILNTPKNVLKKIDKMVIEYHVPAYFDIEEDYDPGVLINHLEDIGFSCRIRRVNEYQGFLFVTRKISKPEKYKK